jgi:hypothetical protein
LLDFEKTAGIVARVRSAVGRSETELGPHFIETSFHYNWSAFNTAIRCSSLHVNGSPRRIVEPTFIVAMKGGSFDVRVQAVGMVLHIDKNRVTGGLFGGHSSSGGGSNMNSASSGCGIETSDGLVNIHIDIRFVNDFPLWSAMIIIY